MARRACQCLGVGLRIWKATVLAIGQGLRTGAYGGPLGHTVAAVVLALTVFVGAGLATGYITWAELAADPAGAVRRTVEPTARSLWP